MISIYIHGFSDNTLKVVNGLHTKRSQGLFCIFLARKMMNKNPNTTMAIVPRERTLKKYLVAIGKIHRNLILKKDRKGYVAKYIAQ